MGALGRCPVPCACALRIVLILIFYDDFARPTHELPSLPPLVRREWFSFNHIQLFLAWLLGISPILSRSGCISACRCRPFSARIALWSFISYASRGGWGAVSTCFFKPSVVLSRVPVFER